MKICYLNILQEWTENTSKSSCLVRQKIGEKVTYFIDAVPSEIRLYLRYILALWALLTYLMYL